MICSHRYKPANEFLCASTFVTILEETYCEGEEQIEKMTSSEIAITNEWTESEWENELLTFVWRTRSSYRRKYVQKRKDRRRGEPIAMIVGRNLRPLNRNMRIETTERWNLYSQWYLEIGINTEEYRPRWSISSRRREMFLGMTTGIISTSVRRIRWSKWSFSLGWTN